jgi:pimeloyl-ACP methyl ester carboxylesterase
VEAFRKDVEDAGHFALEEKGEEVAKYMIAFLARVGWK